MEPSLRQYRAKLENNMSKFKDKICLCGKSFSPTGPAQKYCAACKLKYKAAARVGNYQRSAAVRGLNYGVGTGNHGNHPKGQDSACYSSGKNLWVAARKEILFERKCCERCGKNLLHVTPYERCIHHRDHNKMNNTKENFELLCKRCHQLEHDCAANFKNV